MTPSAPTANTIPRMDWDRAPWNRWSFQHVDQFVATAPVWKGTAPAHLFPMGPRLPFDLPVPGLDGRPSTLAALLDDTFTDGFMVLKHGAIACELYSNGMGPRSHHLSQSVAKSVTGAVAGIFVDRGLLDVAAEVTDYLPELVATGWKGATLQQVLDMTTGVRFSEAYTDPYSEMGQLDVAAGWKPIPPGSDPAFKWPSHVWELIMGLKDTTRPHGQAFEYRSIETDVLAFVLERVTGKRLPQIISEELWQKMGASRDAYFTIDREGYALADGGFNATLRDFARFGQLLAEDGGGIIPKWWIDETRNARHGHFTGDSGITLPDGAYHNKFWIEDSQSRALMASGVFGQLIYIKPETGLVVTKLSTWPVFLSNEFKIATLRAIHAIDDYLEG